MPRGRLEDGCLRSLIPDRWFKFKIISVLVFKEKFVLVGVLGLSFLCGYNAEAIHGLFFRSPPPSEQPLTPPQPGPEQRQVDEAPEPVEAPQRLSPLPTPPLIPNGIAERRREYEQLIAPPPEAPALAPPPQNPYEQLNSADLPSPPSLEPEVGQEALGQDEEEEEITGDEEEGDDEVVEYDGADEEESPLEESPDEGAPEEE